MPPRAAATARNDENDENDDDGDDVNNALTPPPPVKLDEREEAVASIARRRGICIIWLEGRDDNDDVVQRIIISLGERGEKNGG